MADPSLALQGAICARLSADSAVTSAAPGGIHDRGPTAYPGPYVLLGEDQILPADGDCMDGAEIWLTLHAYAEEIGFPALKALGSAVADCLDGADLAVPGHTLVSITHDSTRYERGRDGVQTHAIITFRALTDAA